MIINNGTYRRDTITNTTYDPFFSTVNRMSSSDKSLLLIIYLSLCVLLQITRDCLYTRPITIQVSSRINQGRFNTGVCVSSDSIYSLKTDSSFRLTSLIRLISLVTQSWINRKG